MGYNKPSKLAKRPLALISKFGLGEGISAGRWDYPSPVPMVASEYGIEPTWKEKRVTSS